MSESATLEKLRSEVLSADAAALLPHHRRGSLLMLVADRDLLEVAVAIADNNTAAVTELVAQGLLTKPSITDFAEWCVDSTLRFQFVILQPYVLAQSLPRRQ